MRDPVLDAFLAQQYEQGMALARQSDLLDLEAASRDRFIAHFRCNGLVRKPSGEVVVASDFAVGIWFAPDHLSEVRPQHVLTWLHPNNPWHPNIRPPFMCAGHLPPGVELVDILYQCFEIITYVTWAPHDALNPDAAQWARNHQEMFPVDRRPLKRRAIELAVQVQEQST